MEEHVICIRSEEPKSERKFNQFDVIAATNGNHHDLENDHFPATWATRKKNLNDLSRETALAIMKEWKILKESLPDSIYVRAYEGRIDLLRAVIIGQQGTPFEDGIFVFNIQFSSDFPRSHPNIQMLFPYKLRLKSTLRPDHMACRPRSLGRGTDEKWSVLKYLLLIQENALGSRPYFNLLEKDSLTYNQDMFVLSCVCMLAFLKKPPKHFEEIIVGHLRDRSENIILACATYGLSGGKSSIYTTINEDADGVKSDMKWIKPKLVEEFRRIGSTSPLAVQSFGDTVFLQVLTIVLIVMSVGIVVLISIAEFGSNMHAG